MCFFKKGKKDIYENQPGLIWPVNDEPKVDPVNYDTVLSYLTGSSKRDYNKIFKVADIYRKANEDAAKILGVNNEPVTAIKETETENSDADLERLMDDEDLATQFIETEPKELDKK